MTFSAADLRAFEKQVEKASNFSKAESLAVLKRIGIVGPSGKFAKPYTHLEKVGAKRKDKR